MELSQKLLCLLFLASFCAGGLLGCVFDLLRMSRRLLAFPKIKEAEDGNSPPRRAKWNRGCQQLLLFVEDVLFALLCGIVLILLSYLINDGKIRWLAPVGMACGFFVYTVTIGKLIQKLLARLTRGVRRLLGGMFGFVWKILSFPLKGMYRLIKRVILSPVKRAWIKYRELVRAKRVNRQISDNAQVEDNASPER